MDETKLTRRSLLIAGVAACATCAAADAQTRRAPTSRPADASPLDAGPMSDFAKDGVYDAPLARRQIVIVRHAGKIVAMSGRCTHRNCVLRKQEQDLQALRCPCHASTFDHDGIPLDGPATISLPRFAIRAEKGRLIVDPSKSFEERHWGDAGASVTV